MTTYVFDFDLTLTNKHTGGKPDINQIYISKEHAIQIEKIFKRLVSDGNFIYINSRGITVLIYKYLKHNHPTILQYISGIYGARDINELNENNWPEKKTNILKKLYSPKYKIKFYDDTIENVIFAVNHGFESYHVKSPNFIYKL